MSICAPGNDQEFCVSDDLLKSLVDVWNRHNPSKKISKHSQSQMVHDLITNNCPGKKLYCLRNSDLFKHLTVIQQEEFVDSFRPEMPIERGKWLSTKDITLHMVQYEKKFPEFKFLGALPSDCSYHNVCGLSSIDFVDLIRSGKTKFGVVFNRDRMGQRGSHWVSLFLDYESGMVYFCDSMGKPVSQPMEKIVQDFIQAYKKFKNTKPTLKYNCNTYQKDNSECGVYSMHFIVSMLHGETIEEYLKHPLNYEEINQCRHVWGVNGVNKSAKHRCH